MIGVILKRKLFLLGIFLMIVAIVMLWYPDLFHHNRPQKKWILVNQTKLNTLIGLNKQLVIDGSENDKNYRIAISSNTDTRQPMVESTNGEDERLTKGYNISQIVRYHSNNMEKINHHSNPVEPTKSLKYVFRKFSRLSSASIVPVLPTTLLINQTKLTQTASLNSSSNGNITQFLNVNIVTNTAIQQHSTIESLPLPINMSHFEHFNSTNNVSIGTNNVFNGTNNVSNGTNDVSIGTNNVSNGTNDVSISANNVSNSTNNVSISANNVSNGTNNVSIGANNVSIGANNVSIGANNVSIGANNVSISLKGVESSNNINSLNSLNYTKESPVVFLSNNTIKEPTQLANYTGHNTSQVSNITKSNHSLSVNITTATIPLNSINQSNTNSFETMENVSNVALANESIVSSKDKPLIASASSDMNTTSFENKTSTLSETNDKGIVPSENETSKLRMTNANFSQPSDDTGREKIDGDGYLLDKIVEDFHDGRTTSQSDDVTSQQRTDKWENRLSEILSELRLSAMRNSGRQVTNASFEDKQNGESSGD